MISIIYLYTGTYTSVFVRPAAVVWNRTLSRSFAPFSVIPLALTAMLVYTVYSVHENGREVLYA
jgi:hypothetical protein